MFELKLGHWLNFSLDCQVKMLQQHENYANGIENKRNNSLGIKLSKEREVWASKQNGQVCFRLNSALVSTSVSMFKTLNRRKFHVEHEFNNIVDKFVVKVIKQRNC